MRKYCVLPISYKRDENDNIIVRTILVKYDVKIKGKVHKYFKGCYGDTKYIYPCIRVIAEDKYFSSDESTHIYEFNKTNYRAVRLSDIYTSIERKKLLKKRKYHRYPNHSIKELRGYEFKANNDIEAINIWLGVY